jgi:hypothetical protein
MSYAALDPVCILFQSDFFVWLSNQ